MLQIKNLNFSYDRKRPLFDGLELELPSGHIYGLLGKNGAGKSTLLKLITGLLFPHDGSLTVLGYKPGERDPRFLREIFVITEEFQLPAIRIEHYQRLYSPFYPRFDQALFQEYLREFNLDKTEKLSALSYGQKKNFLLCFGLATDCKLLILDEPTNGLDIPSKSKFRRIVANAIHAERSFIISTHQVRDMENLIDPIIVLEEGKVMFFEDFESISRRLFISRRAMIKQNDPEILYSESYLGGYTVVTENFGGEETHMNLEILFNAVMANPEKMSGIFKRVRNA